MMIDFHTHILPNMDDGSSSVDESLKMLEELEKQNVELVCLTPHFYSSDENVDNFVLRRKKAYESLNYKGNLKLLLGAEVKYYRGISQNTELNKLTLENTNLLLLELPFDMEINENIINEILNITKNNIKVVLAHIERYNLNIELIRKLKSDGIMIQVNNEYIIGSLFNHEGIKLLKQGYIDFLGSDCHNLESRKPNYIGAYKQIKKQLGEEFVISFYRNNAKMI